MQTANNKPLSESDKSRRLKLRTENKLSYNEIARIEGRTPQAIHSSIKDLLPNEETKKFEDNETGILTEVERKFISCLDADTIKELVKRRGLVDFGIVFDKKQHLLGKNPGMNINIFMQAIQAMRDSPD